MTPTGRGIRGGEVMTMTDAELIAALEACVLPEQEFCHAAHVRAGYAYLRGASFPDATARMCRAVRNYVGSLGKHERYHETITVGFMALIAQRLREGGDGGWEAFSSRNPQLLRRDALLAYYPEAVLASAAARSGFVLLPMSQAV
jgi:hypothetical protein